MLCGGCAACCRYLASRINPAREHQYGVRCYVPRCWVIKNVTQAVKAEASCRRGQEEAPRPMRTAHRCAGP
jgi:hypothetical protein